MSEAPSIDRSLEAVREAVERGEGVLERLVPEALRGYLAEVREYLASVHGPPGSGRLVNEAHSDLTDRMVRRLFNLAEETLVGDGVRAERGLCIVAVGGYARREMAIHSDVDLLVLYRGELSPYVASIAERLQYWLWDSGLTVGCATRTIEDTIELAEEDVTVRTAVLTARFLCGDGEFFHDFARAIRARFIGKDPEAFVREQIRNMEERHESYGESLFLLQPNVKEGAGGLRDYHTAYWVARAAQPGTRHPDDLAHFGLLTEEEMKEFRDALDFIWRVRNDLHLRCKRCNDQMSFEHQEQIAESLGYRSPLSEAGPGGGELPVERFMGDYYRHARILQSYAEIVIEQCAARVADPPPSHRARVVEDGFRLREHHVEIPNGSFLEEDPKRLLRVIRVGQIYDLPLSRMARRLVRENLSLIDDAFRRDPECAQLFLDILDAETRVCRSLNTMNETGLLGAFLPEWEHVVCRWQHVIYHTYTVDVHSIFLVEELRRLWRGKYEAEMPELTELMREVKDRPALYLGCLLHDIGKGFGGDHSSIGAERARTCLERLGLSQERRERALFLVQQHLVMSHLAQRRDLSDPQLIFDFAQMNGDRTNLRNLYLCTFADIRASSRDAWNDWKGQLLRELFERSAELLEVGADDPSTAMALIEARVEVRREKALALLVGAGLEEMRVKAYFDSLPRRYFIAHTPAQIARHARVVLDFHHGRTLTCAFRGMRGDFTEMIVCTPDVHGLYGTVAGTITACGINILGSHVYTNREGLALEVYRLTTPPGGAEEIALAWENLEAKLCAVLEGTADVDTLMQSRRRPFGRTQPPSRAEPKVTISNTESEFYTLVDVMTTDRIGLLYELTSAIGRYGLEIYISKAATIQDQVSDTFYLKDAAGKKVRDDAVLTELRRELLEVARAEEIGVRG